MNNENIKKEFEELKNAYKDMFDNISIEQFKQIKEKVENERKITAKEMFEKLGYKCLGGSDYIAIKYYKSDETDIDITFYREKEISIVENEYMNKEYNLTIHFLTLEELQAINKQIEELGWNNE